MSAEQGPKFTVDTFHHIDGHREVELHHDKFTKPVGQTSLGREVTLAEFILREGQAHYANHLQGHYDTPPLQEGEIILTVGMLGYEKTKPIVASRLGKDPENIGWDEYKDEYREVFGTLEAIRKPRDPKR